MSVKDSPAPTVVSWQRPGVAPSHWPTETCTTLLASDALAVDACARSAK
jgi:hypothetical protein